jgi:hypothetical protein
MTKRSKEEASFSPEEARFRGAYNRGEKKKTEEKIIYFLPLIILSSFAFLGTFSRLGSKFQMSLDTATSLTIRLTMLRNVRAAVFGVPSAD